MTRPSILFKGGRHHQSPLPSLKPYPAGVEEAWYPTLESLLRVGLPPAPPTHPPFPSPTSLTKGKGKVFKVSWIRIPSPHSFIKYEILNYMMGRGKKFLSNVVGTWLDLLWKRIHSSWLINLDPKQSATKLSTNQPESTLSTHFVSQKNTNYKEGTSVTT